MAHHRVGRSTLSRRGLFVSLAAAAAAAACGTVSRMGSASAPFRKAPKTVTMRMMSSVPVTAVTAFEQTHPHVRILTSPAGGSDFQLTESIESDEPLSLARWADLTEAVRALNFDAGAYLPGTMAYWTQQGHILGIPIATSPWGVLWRPDAFQAARIPSPTPEWTLADFQNACSGLQELAASGHLTGMRAALGPISSGGYAAALSLEGLWQGFVWGFGGTIGSNGQFTVTDRESVAAIQALCDLDVRFSVSAQDILAVGSSIGSAYATWRDKVFSLVGMAFANYYQESPPEGYAWARLPRFPVQAVIPVLSSGLGLDMSSPTMPLPSATAPETLAAAEFAIWLNSRTGAHILGADGIPPASANRSVQDGFWSGDGPGPASVLGDWRNFRDAYAGFPVIPTKDYVAAAISAVVSGQASVAAALTTAERQLNAEVGH